MSRDTAMQDQPFSLFETIAVAPPVASEGTSLSPELASPDQSGSSLMQLNQLARRPPQANNSISSQLSSSMSGSTSHNYATTNLIVNYIPVEVSEKEFRQLFAQFGDVESCKIVVDRATGYSKGYGFVRYAEASAANEAMTHLDGFTMYNKRLKVGLASRQAAGTDSPAGARIVLRDDAPLSAPSYVPMYNPYGAPAAYPPVYPPPMPPPQMMYMPMQQGMVMMQPVQQGPMMFSPPMPGPMQQPMPLQHQQYMPLHQPQLYYPSPGMPQGP